MWIVKPVCRMCVHHTAVLCGVSQSPEMNICVKQKKLDEEGGRVNEERGLWVENGELGGHSCVRCLPGLPVCIGNLFDLRVCACVCLCIHLFFPTMLDAEG